MTDLTELLKGSVDDVKASLAGLSHDDLLKLKDAEAADKNRKGVLEAIETALSEADKARAGGTVQAAGAGATEGAATTETTEEDATSRPPAIAADLDHSPLAGIAPATTIDTAGAPQQIVPDVDLSHPAVDADPRAGTTEQQNRIDFNDPRKPGHEVVADQLRG